MSKRLEQITHLVLSGGGLLGLSYIGLFKYLFEQDAIKGIKSITGCSAGSMFGSLFAIGYKYDEFAQIAKNINFKEYLNINADSIINFMKLKGLESGTNLSNLIKQKIKDKTGDENITFSQVLKKYNINLQIGVTNLSKSTFEIMNSSTNPDLPIYIAIKASIAIPFIFEPVVIGNDIYCDGGLLDNLPIEYVINLEKETLSSKNTSSNTTADVVESIDDTDTKTDKAIDNASNIENKKCYVLGVYLLNKFNMITSENYQSISMSHYFNIINQSLSTDFINSKLLKYKNVENTNISTVNSDIIVIEIPCDIMTFVKLNASPDDVDNIIIIAYDIVKTYFQLNN
jgi:predicted acylesterase/phospholipase RssA